MFAKTIKYFSYLTNFLEMLGCLLLLLMIVFPYQFQMMKLALSLILCLCLLYKGISVSGTLKLNKYICWWCLLYTIMNMFYYSYGLLLDNPAPNSYVLVYCIWPLMFTLFIGYINLDYLRKITKFVKIGYIAVCLLGIFACVRFNIFLSIEDFMGFRASARPDFPFLAIHSGSIISIIFLYPFYLVMYLLKVEKNSLLDKFGLFLGIVFIFITSRRALYLNVVFSILLSFFFVFFINKIRRECYLKAFYEKMFIVFVFVICFLFCNMIWSFIDLTAIGQFVTDALGNAKNVESAGSYDARIEQLAALISGWLDSPIFGNGTGVDASVSRSDTPGTYELTYVALLFERGVVGFVIYFIQFALLFVWYLRRIYLGGAYSEYLIPMLVAFILFMFANGTNPYLLAFDHLWILFLPISYLNILLNNHEKGNLRINSSF